MCQVTVQKSKTQTLQIQTPLTMVERYILQETLPQSTIPTSQDV